MSLELAQFLAGHLPILIGAKRQTFHHYYYIIIIIILIRTLIIIIISQSPQ